MRRQIQTSICLTLSRISQKYSFITFYIKPNTLLDTSVNKETPSTKLSIATKLQEVQTESQGSESHSEATEPMPTKFQKPEPKIEIQNEDSGIQSRGK